MQNHLNKSSLTNSPVLWGLLGILVSGTCNIAVNVLFKFLETILLLGKANVLSLKIVLLASCIVSILVLIILIIFLLKLYSQPRNISKVWVIVLLILWPLFSIAQYYLNMATVPLIYHAVDFKELQDLQSFRGAMALTQHLAYIITILVTTIYLMSGNRKVPG